MERHALIPVNLKTVDLCVKILVETGVWYLPGRASSVEYVHRKKAMPVTVCCAGVCGFLSVVHVPSDKVDGLLPVVTYVEALKKYV